MMGKLKMGLVGSALVLSLAAAIPAGMAFADESPENADAPATTSSDISVRKNNVDRGYDFYFSGYGTTQGTNWRAKEDTSSVYVKISSRWGAPPRFYTDGAYSNNTGAKDCTQGIHYANRVGEFNIYNSIRESGRSRAFDRMGM